MLSRHFLTGKIMPQDVVVEDPNQRIRRGHLNNVCGMIFPDQEVRDSILRFVREGGDWGPSCSDFLQSRLARVHGNDGDVVRRASYRDAGAEG